MDRLELKVSIRESRGVVVDVVDACGWASSCSVESVLAGPVTAEVDVDDNVGRCEVGSNVAVGVGEVSIRSTLEITTKQGQYIKQKSCMERVNVYRMRERYPVIGVHRRCTARYIRRNGGVRGRPEPDFDEVVCPFHRIDSTSVLPVVGVGESCVKGRRERRTVLKAGP